LIFASPSSIAGRLRNAGQFVSTLRAVPSWLQPGAVFKSIYPRGASPYMSDQFGCAKIQRSNWIGGNGGGPGWQNAGTVNKRIVKRVPNNLAKRLLVVFIVVCGEWSSLLLRWSSL
jgi:hypothetical protein